MRAAIRDFLRRGVTIGYLFIRFEGTNDRIRSDICNLHFFLNNIVFKDHEAVFVDF